MTWLAAATAPDQIQAEMWRDMLLEEGIAALVHSGDTASFLGVSLYPCRVMVEEENIERARETLARTPLGSAEPPAV